MASYTCSNIVSSSVSILVVEVAHTERGKAFTDHRVSIVQSLRRQLTETEVHHACHTVAVCSI